MKATATVALALGLAFPGPVRAGEPTDEFARIEAVSAHVLDVLKAYDVPGASVALFRDFEIEWARGYGVANAGTKQPVEPLTLFQAASISKPVAALVAMRLAQQGRLDLDRNVNAYLTAWTLPENDLTRATPVTLRQVLSHTGGLTVHGFKGYAAGGKVPTVLQVLDGQAPANSEPVRVTLAPRTKFEYSGGGYTVLQQLLVDVTGTPFAELMGREALRPLGMRLSTYEQPLPDRLLKFATAGHEKGKMIAGERHTYPEMAAAGLWTTATDLARFAIAVQRARAGHPEPVLSRENALLMTTAYLPDSFGLGLELFPPDTPEKKYFGHTGGNAGYRCWLLATNEGGHGVAILTNGDQWKAVKEIADKVREVYGF
jgi:CubicO group peptidase (beta-lactamase class C family)